MKIIKIDGFMAYRVWNTRTDQWDYHRDKKKPSTIFEDGSTEWFHRKDGPDLVEPGGRVTDEWV